MSNASGSNSSNKILKRANPSTIQDKFLVGYQGWFTCAGDGQPVGPGHHGWLHWFNYPMPDGGRPNTDLWPDVSAYAPSELFAAPGLKFKNGEQAFLFSSRNAKTVQRHFHWMAEHGVDGAFLQRFAGQCDVQNGSEGIKRIRDEVGQRVREAAEREGRVFAIMYDVSGVPADRIQHILEHDWMDLVRQQGVLDSPNYLREKGKPVVGLWGFGFHNSGHTLALVRSITQFFRTNTPGGAYIFGGAPSCWRLAEGDSEPIPEFKDVWLNEFDAISPWTIGRYKTEQEADNFYETKMKPDHELIKRRNEETGRKVDYVPVVLPGGSGYNLSEGKWGFNDIRRYGGRFLWKQIFNGKRLGVRTMYGAMWDEYDEGTAFMPVVEHKHKLPVSDKFQFLALDADGYDVPSDWYMRICGFAAEGLRSERRIHETFPVKELQDYWASRPKYEEVSEKSSDFVSGSASTAAGASSSAGGGDGQTYDEWLANQKDNKDEPPPPAYSLIEDEPAGEPAAASSSIQPQPEPAPPSPTLTQTTGLSSAPLPSQAPAQAHAPQPSVVSASIQDGRNAGSTAHQAQQPVTHSPAGVSELENGQVASSGQAGPGLQAHPNFSTYPGYYPGGSAAHSPHAHTPAASPHSVGGAFQAQQQQLPLRHDTMGALASDFGRQHISGPSYNETSTVPRPTTVSPPPIHQALPGPYGRPTSNPNSRPQSRQDHHKPPPAAGPVPSPTQQHGAHSSAQWPPPEWGIQSTSTQPPSAYPGGANLSRPSTFSASSITHSGGSNLRPSATISGGSTTPAHKPPPRPSSVTGQSSQRPHGSYSYHPQSAIAEHPPSTYPPPSGPGMATQPPTGAYGGPSYSAGPDTSFYMPHQQAPSNSYSPAPPTGHGFPSVSSYAPSSSAYPNPSGLSSYPGQTAGPSAYSSSYNWSGTPNPHISPPQSPPLGGPPGPSFPSQSGYSYNNAYNSPGPSFPSTQGGSGEYGFPDPSGGYYGGGQAPPNSYPSTPYSGQPSSPTGTPGFPGGPSYPGSSMPAPGPNPWMPDGPGPSGSPAMPPRPPTHPGSSYGGAGPTFPATGTPVALNYALSAVGKVAGKKTEQQLGSLAQNVFSGSSSLYNKFMK